MAKKNKAVKTVQQVDFKQSVINENTDFNVLEAYKAIRTNVMFTLAGEEGCKKVMVTSSGAGEGKSTSTINLAISFAQMGARILIIDADMRRPIIHRYLEIENNKGLSEYLGGFVKEHKEIIHHIAGYENLDCITGGHVPPNPSELLISSATKKLLDKVSEDYDYIFIDTPPVNVVIDAVSIAKLMSGAIVVARQDHVTTDAVEQAVSALEFGNGKILGYIFNCVKMKKSRKYSKYQYSYGYGHTSKK